jgi:hypothetical protein
MPYCPNPDCPHRQRLNEPAEFNAGITTCSDCGSPLSETAPHFESIHKSKKMPIIKGSWTCPECGSVNTNEISLCTCGYDSNRPYVMTDKLYTKPTEDEDAPIKDKPPLKLRIVIWTVSFIISGFYILSAFGWFMATYMMSIGVLGAEATEFYRSLNIADKLIRAIPVILMLLASITLLCRRRITLKLVLICILASFISFLFISKWSISFLAGASGILMLVLVYAYAYWLDRRGFLR